MKPCFDQRFSRFYFAGDTLTDAPFRSERNQSGIGTLSIALFQRCLQRPDLISVHLSPFDLVAVG
jgi:hypothetical protein